MDLQARFVLSIMVELVWHIRVVISDSFAQWYRYFLTRNLLCSGATRALQNTESKKQVNSQQVARHPYPDNKVSPLLTKQLRSSPPRLAVCLRITLSN